MMNPIRRFSVKSAVPGRALSDSAAPPTTIVKLDPGPVRRKKREVVSLPVSPGPSDREKRTLLEDVLTRLHADGADAEREDKVAVERDLEVGSEGEEVRVQAGEELGETGSCGGYRGGFSMATRRGKQQRR